MKYIISTLGCKVNQFETQAMETLLQADGWESAAPGEIADAVIVNTCAVTAESGRKSRQVIRRLRDENPDAVIGVCGCFAQLSPEDTKEIGADVIFGTQDKAGFVSALEKAAAGQSGVVEIDQPFKRRAFEQLPAGAVNGRTRAMLKIQDGCVNFCTYCIIPYTRGRLLSLPVEDAARQTAELAERGYRELVLTGIEIASYGVDLPGKPGLIDVIEACAAVSGDMRLHLGSLEPTVVTEDFCRRAAATGKLCRHFHLALQSGCDRTLKAMNRKYDTAFFYETAERLRRWFPGCAITCDMITGFPGETDRDQADTLAFIRKCGFSAMHIFPYSRRPGTPADKMSGQCTNAVKNARSREAQKVAEEMHQAFLRSSIGQTLPVLFETNDGVSSFGHSDTYLVVGVPELDLRGRIRNVRITGVNGDELTGELV